MMAAEQTFAEVLREHSQQINAHMRKAGVAEMDRRIAELKAGFTLMDNGAHFVSYDDMIAAARKE
jgi:hypothetical protein